jgi:DNA modification methylase
MSSYMLAQGEVLTTLQKLPSNSFDALLTDPPYGLGSKEPTAKELIAYLSGAEMDTGGDFMGNDWHVPSVAVWKEVFRVLKPGAPLLVFAGSRTQDLISLGMRAAGFEICDVIDWIYGQGMPKPATTTDKYIDKALKSTRPVIGTQALSGSAGVSTAEKGGTFGVAAGSATKVINLTAPGSPEAEQWEGYGHGLCPGREPVILACKPFDGTIAHNVLTHGTGALNVKGCRIGTEGGTRKAKQTGPTDSAQTYGNGLNSGTPEPINAGRWPKNVILSEETAAELDATVGDRPSTLTGRADPTKTHDNPGDNGDASWFGGGNSAVYADGGGPSRFFYCAKVSKSEREKGCEPLPLRSAAQVTNRKEGTVGADRPQAGAGRGSGARNHHPTLKPLALTEYLAKLILQPTPEACLLIPYAGAGSELIGALKAGWPEVYAIERDPEFCEIAPLRVAAHTSGASRIT